MAAGTDTGRPRVIVVGAGFGGLWAVRTLAHSSADVLLIDKNNYHVFLPLLYQVAASELEPEEIAFPIRSILRRLPNVSFLMAGVTGIDLNEKSVRTTQGNLSYDYLILAVGTTTQFFRLPGAEENAFPLKTMAEGIALRNHILRCFERAAYERDTEAQNRALTFTIVGGGPTGVEFGGALTELIRGPVKRDYPGLNLDGVRVVLLEAADALLPGQPERLRTYTLSRLRKMGVDVRLSTTVGRVEKGAVHLAGGTIISTETVVWTAGVQGEPAVRDWGFPTAKTGQVAVLPTLQTPGFPETYVIGDLAYIVEGGKRLPLIAPVAIQQGEAAGRNVLRRIAGQDPLPFRYRDKGSMVTLGRNAAVANLGGMAFTGFPAWLIWLIIHIFNLIGFRNRLFVLINWAWDYFFYERTVRLIFP